MLMIQNCRSLVFLSLNRASAYEAGTARTNTRTRTDTVTITELRR